MRKKLVSLGFALAAAAALSAVAPATASTSAKSCPSGTYEFQCSNFTVCCHIGALCHC